MDIHRCRFVPFNPSAINAVAFSHPQPRTRKQAQQVRLAVGRANGDIEIWNQNDGSWHQELVIRGGKARSVDGLVWVDEPDQDVGEGRVIFGKSRLFSIGSTRTITEWDLEKGKPKRQASGQHGNIWCIAAQPTASNGTNTQISKRLVAGTIDGELVTYSLEDDDLSFHRVVVRSSTKKAQIVSLTFQSPQIAIVGCSDSTILAYNLSNGSVVRRMTLGADFAGGAKDTIVWSVKCLPDGDIVSGDSTGQVCIWDGKTYTQAQRLQSHKQDVLSLVISVDGQSLLSGGMDRRTVLHKKMLSGRWDKVAGRRYHEHDVKSMSSFESGRVDVVVSGGPDAKLVVLPLKEMMQENHRTLGSLPQQPPMATAPKSRFLVTWRDREISVWGMRKGFADLDEDEDLDQNKKLLKTMYINDDSNITSAAINSTGTLLVVATTASIKAFRLEHQNPVKPADVKPYTVQVPQQLGRQGAACVNFSPNDEWLGLVQGGSRVVVARVDENGFSQVQKLPRLRRKIPRQQANSGLGAYDRNVTHLVFAAGSDLIATANLAGYIDTWILGQGATEADDASGDSDSSEDDTPGAWVRNPVGKLLPKLPSAPVVLSFSDHVPGKEVGDGSDSILLAITSQWDTLTLHPRKGSLTRWSRLHTKKNLPAPIQDLLDLPKGAIWDGSRVWVYGASFLFMLDLAYNLEEVAPQTNDGQVGVKRKRTGSSSGAGGKMEQGNLAPRRIRRWVAGEWEDVEMHDVPQLEEMRVNGDADSDGDEDNRETELGLLRISDDGETSGELVEATGQRYKWWITFKYRAIIGMVPLNSANEPLEVMLVERPSWDLELPETYHVEDEWKN